MSQIGFILVGTGTAVFLSGMTGSAASLPEKAVHFARESVELAHSGLILHMVNHSLIKLTLFMAAGVFVMNLGKLNLNEIRGYGRKKPLLLIPFALGALGISGVPFFNGYISKTLLHEGLVAAREAMENAAYTSYAGLLHGIEWIFLISGGLTFAYMLKLFICVFVEKPERESVSSSWNAPCMNCLSTAVLLLSAILLPLLGQPAIAGTVAAWMAGEDVFAHFHAFSWTNLSGSLISLGIGACVYLLIVRRLLMRAPDPGASAPASSGLPSKQYADLWPRGLDLEDRIYRPLLLTVLPAIGGAVASVFAENKILRPLCRMLFRAGGAVASAFAENRILIPLCRALFCAGGILAQFFSVSTDGLLILFHDTFMRERVVRADRIRFRRLRSIQKSLARAYSTISMNFSFGLMMTCLGIIVILAVILASHYL